MSLLWEIIEAQEEKNRIRGKVIEFHKAFGQAIGNHPEVPDKEIIKLRLNLIYEEFKELLQAAGWIPAFNDIDSFIDNGKFDIDLVKFADAMSDLDYAVERARLAFGINGEPILDAVHKANMAKLGGGKRADGKVQKPVDWKPPDIEGELVKQGWKK